MSQRTPDVKANAPLGRGASPAESLPGDVPKERGFKDLNPIADAESDFEGASPNHEDEPQESLAEEIRSRVIKLEKQNFRMKLAITVLVMVVGYLGFEQLLNDGTIIKRTLMESRELKLLDNEGNARMFLRMYSRVPVLQLLDSNGKPRLSLGMRFDDTPFIDLSDRTGRTRATLELTEKDEPALSMFDENGDPTFKIN